MVRVKKWFEQLKPFVKPVLIVWAVNVFCLFAVLRSNFSYVDDLARTVEGYKGWGNFSRYLSNFLAMFVNGNATLTDISPWTQILAALIMAIAGVILLYIIYGRKKFRWWELAVAVLLAINPYFLECLSYKFDAPFIALAILAMIVPFVMRGRKTSWYVASVLMGTLVTCTTYQAALGILPMVTVVLALRMWAQGKSGKEIWGLIWKTMVGYGVGLVIFKVFIMRAVEAYVVTAMPGLLELGPQVAQNLQDYYSLVVSDFTTTWLVVVGLVIVGFVVIMMIDAKRKKWLAGLLAVASVVVLGVLCFGIYVVMELPLFKPRAMLGFGVMIGLLAIVVVEERKLAQTWQKVAYGMSVGAAVVLVYLFGVFGFTYGNALALQKEWVDFRIEAVIDDLDEVLEEGQTIFIVGSVGQAPAINTAVGIYPVLGRLVPVEFESGYWGQYKLFNYYGLKEYEGNFDVQPVVEEYAVVKESQYHNIQQRGAEIVIELK